MQFSKAVSITAQVGMVPHGLLAVAITQHMPEITAVLDVTEHAEGDNPYYQQSKK